MRPNQQFYIIYVDVTLADLKGQSNEIFDLHFFHYSNLPGPLINGFKYLRFWLRFRESYSNVKLNKTDWHE